MWITLTMKGKLSSMTPKQIKALRKRLKLTGDQLARKLGVTGNTVRRWECGARNPSGPAVVLLRGMVRAG